MEVCQLDSNPQIQPPSSSLNVDTSRFLLSVFGNSNHDLRVMRWNPIEAVLFVFILKCSYNSYAFSGS
jgi:hypothetical protein